jgi:MFS transporter, DHA2 family, multidrug resistance protein
MDAVSEANGRPEVHPYVVAFTVVVSMFMEVLDSTVVNVSLPHIAGNLSSTVEEATWVLTSYLVANAIVLPMTGWFSSFFGRKRFYMICVAIFTFSSLMCGLSTSLRSLVFFRVLQGAGGGAMQPISQAITVESFPRDKLGMAMAIFGMGVILAPIIGPSLGGWITDNYNWHWIFLINIPIGIISLILTSIFVHDPPYLERKSLKGGVKVDYIGLALICVGLGFLQITLDKGQQEDWLGSNFIVTTTILAVCGLVGAVVWELRQKDPIVDLRLLKDRNFGLATFTMLMVGFVLYGSTVVLPLMLQNLLGYTALLSGLVLSPGGIVVLLMMPIVGRLSQRFEARWLLILGVSIFSLSLFHMASFNLNIDFTTAMTSRMWQSLGMAFLFIPINTSAFYFIAQKDVNRATGLINLARNVGGSLGISLVATIISRRQQFHQSVLVSGLDATNPIYQSTLGSATQMLMMRGSDPVQASGQAHGIIYGIVQRHSAMLAFLDAFWVMGVLFLVIIPLAFLMKKGMGHKDAVAAH